MKKGSFRTLLLLMDKLDRLLPGGSGTSWFTGSEMKNNLFSDLTKWKFKVKNLRVKYSNKNTLKEKNNNLLKWLQIIKLLLCPDIMNLSEPQVSLV